MSLNSAFVQKLRTLLDDRRMSLGMAMLERAETEISRLDTSLPFAADLLLCIAQWVDAGYRDPQFLADLIKRFSPRPRESLTILDYLRLRMTEAFHAMSVERPDSAIDILRFVLEATEGLTNSPVQELAVLANFWKGRAHRQKGDYDAALTHIVNAREGTRILQRKNIFRAIISVQEAWLLFQKGAVRDALHIYDEAEAELRSTDHTLLLGNIESGRGRIVRRAGEYKRSLVHFDNAIAFYSLRNQAHRNFARALVNAAYSNRLLALQLRNQIDHRAQGKRDLAHNTKGLHTRYITLCQQALQQLRQAGDIYQLQGHHTGAGTVLVNTGYLHLDQGNIAQAEQESVQAFDLAVQKHDLILMARARTLQVYIALAHVDDEVGEEADTAAHAHAALHNAELALGLAQQTQNNRLIAGAWIAKGFACGNDFFQDWAYAKLCAGQAADRLNAQDRDHLTEELARLKARIMHAAGIDDTLRMWSEGVVSHKTFQQVLEEFAEIVIPRVWMREDRKISRVATSLSISPKKVRRILRKVQLIGDGHES
jgi:tetratricopeptide (TPR) repeat protein